VLDGLDTRFQAVTALETVTVGERVFVLAGGADDGVSLFTLLPDGRLLHLAALADTTRSSLANVQALVAAFMDGQIQVFVTSESNPGITQLAVDPGPLGRVLRGEAAADRLVGTADNDLLAGGAGDDSLFGGAGDDILTDGAGQDHLSGGAGADIFVLTADGQRDLIVDFDPTQDRLDLSGFIMFRNVAQLAVTVTTYGAILRFVDETVEIRTVSGRPLTAADVARLTLADLTHLLLPSAPVNPPVPPPTPGHDLRVGSARDDTINGAAGNDTLFGSQGDDRLFGGTGNDRLVGGAGADLLDGGAGTDAADYTRATAAVRADLVVFGRNSGEALYDSYAGIENLYGSRFGDDLAGSAAANLLLGLGGNDTLTGRLGHDTLNGGDGHDLLTGGAGADLLIGGGGRDRAGYAAASAGVVADLWLFSANRGEAAGDRYSLVEDMEGTPHADNLRGDAGGNDLFGGSGNDWLFGRWGDDRLYGGLGDDWLLGGAGRDLHDGGPGADTVYYRESPSGLRADLQDPAQNNGIATGDRYSGIEHLTGSASHDNLRGDRQANRVDGGDGNDVLFGRDGHDTIIGGSGNDRLFGGTGADVFVFAGGRDVIGDFQNDSDMILLDRSLFSGAFGPAQIIASHASVLGGNTVFDFGGGDVLIVFGVTVPGWLVDDIGFF